MPSPNHYEVLGLDPSASTEEIARRHDELVRLYGADGAQAPMVRLIEEANRVLSNAGLRQIYDSGIAPKAPPASEAAPTPRVPQVPSSYSSEQEITQAIPTPELERTTIVEPALPAKESETALPSEKQIASELAKRGVASDEVQRLLKMGQPEAPAKGAKPLVPALVVPPSQAYEPKPKITLPAFRESSTDEKQRAERMLTNANIARRRAQFVEAERECRAALDLIPKDAPALELYGDILQSLGRVDDALYSYQRATEADEARKTAEKKYAELMLLQNREIDLLREENIPRSSSLAVILSAVFPGVGQIYNGDTLKGVVILVIVSSCIFLLGWSPYGFHKGLTSISPPLAFFTIVALFTYAFALVDANIGAKRGKRKSGWDI
jgi:tetratricopeptide (TPR) repeat protein